MILLSTTAEALPLYEQIYTQLKEQITVGERKAGDRLPSKRVLAAQLNVSVNTVDAAYRQLESEGYVTARPKSGFYVCAIDALVDTGQASELPAAAPAAKNDILVDFSPSGIAQDKFPKTVWLRLLRSCMEQPSILQRTPNAGDPGLREAIAAYLYRARGVHCTAEQIVIGPGTDSLLSMLSFILPSSFCFLVENPVYNRAYRHFARMGHQVAAAEIDHQGVRPELLRDFQEAVLYTTPSHQYPLGISMPMGRRVQLLNWCSRGKSRYVIEDDYDSEFRYDSKPLPSLQSIDTAGCVIYMGTFSRSVAPSVRISYMVLPGALLEQFRAQYGNVSSGVSTLEQAVLREFLQQGYFEKHVNRMRVYYRRQRNYFMSLLEPYADEIEVIGEAAGHHLAVRVRRWTERELCRRALAEQVKVYPISDCFLGGMPKQYESKVLLGFGSLSRQQLEIGTERLCSAWFR